MRTRIEGLVQLKSGDAVRGVISRMGPLWKYVRIDNATAMSPADPNPSKVDGVVWVPKTNISFVQEITL